MAQSIVVGEHMPAPSQALPVNTVSAHAPGPHGVPVSSGLQVPGEVGRLQLTQAPEQSESQQTPSAPQTPLRHSSVGPQVVPGLSLALHMPFLQ